jgi:hypothetical protein
MCLIVDTNRFGDVLGTPPKAAYVKLIEWLISPKGIGVIVFGGSKFRREIALSEKARRWYVQLERAGRAKSIDDATVDAEEKALKDRGVCASDDEHIIALARKSGARVVCTEDQLLWRDIKNTKLLTKPRGRVYRRAKHAGLLRHDRKCQRPTGRN